MIITRVTSEDFGAPQLANVDGSLTDVLDYILVTKGGWSTTFTGTNRRIYRTSAGNRRSLLVDHNTAVSGTSYWAAVRMCDSATDINTLVNPVPLISQFGYSAYGWNPGFYMGAVPRYVAYVSPLWVYFFSRQDSGGGGVYFFGDVLSPGYYGTDTHNTVIIASSEAYYQPLGYTYYGSNANITSNYNGSSQQNLFWAGDISGATLSTMGTLSIIPSYSSGSSGTVGMKRGYGNLIIRQRIPISCSGTTAFNSSGVNALAQRGYMPNWYSLVCNGNLGYTDIGDVDKMLVTDPLYNVSAVLRFVNQATNATPGQATSIFEETDTYILPPGV